MLPSTQESQGILPVRKELSEFKDTPTCLFNLQQRGRMPIEIRIRSEGCTETGRDAVFSLRACSVFYHCYKYGFGLDCILLLLSGVCQV